MLSQRKRTYCAEGCRLYGCALPTGLALGGGIRLISAMFSIESLHFCASSSLPRMAGEFEVTLPDHTENP